MAFMNGKMKITKRQLRGIIREALGLGHYYGASDLDASRGAGESIGGGGIGGAWDIYTQGYNDWRGSRGADRPSRPDNRDYMQGWRDAARDSTAGMGSRSF